MDTITLSGDSRARARAHDKRIAVGALKVGLLVLLAKLCIAGREIAIAYRYGTSAVVDAYNLAFTVVTWVPVMVSAAAGVALVPTLVRLRKRPERYSTFVSEFNALILMAGFGIVLVTSVAGPPLAAALAEGVPSSTAKLAASMTWSMASVAGLLLIANLCALRLQAEERFLYSFFEAMPALFVSAAALMVGHVWAPEALIWGTVVGGAVQIFALAIMLRGTSVGVGGLGAPTRSSEWRHVWGGLLAVGLGQALLYSSVPLDQYIAARSGSGGIAILGYTNRLIGVATSMGTVVLARSLLPITAATIAAGDEVLAWRQARRWSLLMLGLAGVAAAIGIWIAPWAITLLLQRGAFSAADALAVASATRMGLLQLPFYMAGLVIVQWLAAHGQYKRIALIAALALIAKFLTLAALSRSWSVEAVMISTTVMYVVSFALQFGCLYDNKMIRRHIREGCQR